MSESQKRITWTNKTGLRKMTMKMTLTTRPISSLHRKLRPALRTRVRGPWPIPCWTKKAGINEMPTVWVNLWRPWATWNEVGLYLHWKRRCVSLTLKSAARALFAVVCKFVDCCYLGFLEDQLSMSWEKMSSAASWDRHKYTLRSDFVKCLNAWRWHQSRREAVQNWKRAVSGSEV